MNKKILIGVLVVVLVLILAFCAIPRNDSTEPMQGSTEPISAPTAEPTAAPTEYTLPAGEGFESDTTIETKPTEAPTQPTEGKDDSAETKPVSDKGKKPEETTVPTNPAETVVPTEPAETTTPTESDDGGSEYCNCKYAQYLAMSPAGQQSYMDSFDSPMAFIEWCRTAEKEHNNHDTSIKVEGGDLDVGDFVG